jgi:putative thioredoxin
MIDSVNSPNIHEDTVANFQALVLANSQQGPVLVNFWSKKAGPCLRQYPILDKLIHHYAGRLLLINIDTEQEVRVSKDYGITSVPVLKLFRHEQVVETLHGFQSEAELSKVLDRYVTRESDLTLAKAIKLYSENKRIETYDMIANAIVADQENPRLPLTVCKLLKYEERYAEALKLINALPGEIRQNTEIVQFHDHLSFYVEVDPARDMQTLLAQIISAPAASDIKQQLIAHYVMQQQYESALQLLVNIMDNDAGYNDNYAQKAMLRIFNIIGREHPLVVQYCASLQRYKY